MEGGCEEEEAGQEVQQQQDQELKLFLLVGVVG
jgi:hypothetical protein